MLISVVHHGKFPIIMVVFNTVNSEQRYCSLPVLPQNCGRLVIQLRTRVAFIVSDQGASCLLVNLLCGRQHDGIRGYAPGESHN